jgi:hypothetical protein
MGINLRVGGTLELSGMDQIDRSLRVQAHLDAFVQYYPDFMPTISNGADSVRGLRSVLPGRSPYVGRTRSASTCSVGTGHAMMGVSLAPITGKVLAQTIAVSRRVDFALPRRSVTTDPTRKDDRMQWTGVISAMTTAFKPDESVDHDFVARHARWQIENGVDGIVALGSLGDRTLTFDEEGDPEDRGPALEGGRSCRDCVARHRRGGGAGQGGRAARMPGFAVLPAYVYSTDWREMKAHVERSSAPRGVVHALQQSTPAYKTDSLAPHIADLARENRTSTR